MPRFVCTALSALAFVALCVMQSGCATPIWPFDFLTPKQGDRTKTTPPTDSISSKSSPTTGTVRVVHLAFDVIRAEMPIDGEMNSLKVWNHVDPLRVGAETAAQLARNGLRVAAGSKANWTAIKAILDAGSARTTRDQLLAQIGAPVLVDLGTVANGESYFAYGKDMRLQGKTFGGGSKILQIDYAFHPDLGGTTDLQIGFEVRRELGELVWERQPDGSIRQVQSVERHVFDELKAALTLQEGEFLVIGPSEQAKNEYRVGSRFFLHGAPGDRKEFLLFITPQPFQTEGAKKPA